MEEKKIVSWIGLLVIKDKKVLMVKEYDKDFYVLPGGRIEKGEGVIEALKRELKEELGVGVSGLKKYGKYLLPGRHEGAMMSFTVYTGKLIGKMTRGEDIESVMWLDTHYSKESLKVGSVTSIKLFPELKSKNLIN